MTDSVPKHPGKILFDQVMTPLGVSRNKLARDIDVPVGRISDVVAGKRGVTPDTALRFAKYFGTTAELWLRLQADYDLYVARTTSWQDAEPKVSVFEPANGISSSEAERSEETRSAEAMDLEDDAFGSEEDAGSDTGVALDRDTEIDGTSTEEPDDDLPSEIDPDDGNIDIPEPAGQGAQRPENS